MDAKRIDIPSSAVEQHLCYKVWGELAEYLTFLPPLVEKYEKAPLYVVIPGGGWHSRNRRDMLEFSRYSVSKLRSQGFAVASVDYRTTKDGVLLDDIITDCFDALRYLATYAEVLQIDKNRIITSGHSAGGHLALMLAVAPPDLFDKDHLYPGAAFRVIGSAPLSPGTYFYGLDGEGAPYSFAIDNLFGGDHRLRHLCSPYDYIRQDMPPVLLVYGDHDPLVLPANSQKFHQKCREVGADCRLVAVRFGGHSFECMVEGQSTDLTFEDTQQAVVDFVLELIQ